MEILKMTEPDGRQKPKGAPVVPDAEKRGGEHSEAVEFFERHRDFLEHYAKGRVRIEPAPAGLDTFAFNLENNVIYVNSMFYKKRGLSEEKTLFAICHEIEHFLEKKAMLDEEGGEKNFDRYLAKIKSSRAFGLMDNCNGDIRENRSVVSRTNEGMGELEKKMYQEDLFSETDFTSQPRHIQFSQAFLVEARLTGEKCQVSPEVRKALDEVAMVDGLIDVMTDPGTPMSMRLKLQDKYIWPKVEALLKKDMEEKKKQNEKKQESGEGKGEKNEKQDEGGDGQSQEGQGDDDQKEGGKEGRPQKGQKQEGQKNEEEKGGTGKRESSEENDPNKIFADEYERAEKNFPQAISVEEIEKAIEKWKEAQRGKNMADQADEDYAKKIGVEKKDLQEYRGMVEKLEAMTDPETGVGIMEELRNLFSRIISKRMKKAQAPKYPVEEGDELVDPAQLVADVRSGNLQPKVWEDTEIREKKGDRFGEVEITLICDRSGSMNENGGKKAIEQRKTAVLMMEVLNEFAELCAEEKMNVDKPLEVSSEIYSFSNDKAEDYVPLKKMSTELGEAERIGVMKKLGDISGTTTDFHCLEAIAVGLDDKTRTRMKIGELKKIVIVFTDGESDDPSRVQGILKNLRDSGVVAIGVGITADGAPTLSTYAPDAQVVEDVQKLPLVMGELLKEHLKEL